MYMNLTKQPQIKIDGEEFEVVDDSSRAMSYHYNKLFTNKPQESQNDMVEPCLENVTRSHTKSNTEMDTHRENNIEVVPKKTAWRRSIIR